MTDTGVMDLDEVIDKLEDEVKLRSSIERDTELGQCQLSCDKDETGKRRDCHVKRMMIVRLIIKL